MRASWLALAVLASLPFLFGCDSDNEVMYRNETPLTLSASVEGHRRALLYPQQRSYVSYGMPLDDPFRLRVTDSKSCLVYSLDTTLRELKAERDLTITIHEEDAEYCIPNG